MSNFFGEDNKFMGNTDYFKVGSIPNGETVKVRALSTAITGWEYWEEMKPRRFRPKEKPRAVKDVSEFVAFLIWNYELQKVQIWSFKQQTIKKSLEKLIGTYGDPLSFDILVTRMGTEKETRYYLKALPGTKCPKEAKELIEMQPLDLALLYEGKDPWKEVANEVA
jgi:hypothetical protein